MGQKVNPVGFRSGVVMKWASNWCAKNLKLYGDKMYKDILVRACLKKKLAGVPIGRITIDDFTEQRIEIAILAQRPAIITGKKGALLDSIRSEISAIVGQGVDVVININEIKRPELDAQCMAIDIARQIENRASYKRAMKSLIQRAMKAGADGIKVRVSGRLNGAEIARSEWLKEGNLPLHTLKANIDYATSTAKTTYGIIGVKIWIYKGNFNIKAVSAA